MKEKVKQALIFILGVFFVCEIVKFIEFVFIKTDQTFLGENIICKLFCILVIFIIIKTKKWTWRDLGFKKQGFFKGMLFGFALGISTFAISYFVEFIILWSMGKEPSLQFFITNFAISNQNVMKMSAMALIICIIGNIVNVWAEEGLFRGLFLKIGTEAFGFKKSNLLQAGLFGLWHVISPILWVLDGSMNVPTAIVMAIGYIILGGVLAYEWGLVTALTGTLWTASFEHFFNNFISNTVHTVTETGIDELQIVRIVLSNILSLVIVLVVAKKRQLNRQVDN